MCVGAPSAAECSGQLPICSRFDPKRWVYSEGHPSGNRPLIGSGLGIRMDFDDPIRYAPIAADARGLVAITGIHVVASGLLSIEL